MHMMQLHGHIQQTIIVQYAIECMLVYARRVLYHLPLNVVELHTVNTYCISVDYHTHTLYLMFDCMHPTEII